jgi:quinol-cytochrome oxidoreductase complex cytochrome b subunit
VPRPDWYLLLYLLRIFKWPDTVVLATVGIPTILMVILFALPFIDRSTERRLARRPVAIITAILTVIAMGVLTWKGATVREFVASESESIVAEWQEKYNLPDAAMPGATLVAEAGCLSCHVSRSGLIESRCA